MIYEKSPEESKSILTQIVLPNDANGLGNLMGGSLLHMIDIVGALAAMRHSNSDVVTAAIDSVSFKHPIKMGEVVELYAQLVWVGNTSMEVKIEVFGENTKTGERTHTNDAKVVYVALDKDGKPHTVPKLKLKSPEEKKEFEEAAAKRAKI